MRSVRNLLGFFLASVAVLAQEGGQKGIELADMNRNVEACSDFFEFSNGAWRAINPIPPSMSRWSRRWQAGEESKDRLKGILEEAAAVKNAPKGSVDQLIGDFYGACMNEAELNRLGVKPLDPLRAEIRAMKSAADVQRMITRFQLLAIPVPFGVGAGSDNHNPTDVLAQIYASGLGLPDRDYYLKPDARFKEAREKYVAHVAKMFQLAGSTEAQADGGRGDRHEDGDAAGRGLARQRRAARSEGDRPQDDHGGAAEAHAPLRLDGLLQDARHRAGRPQRQRAALPAGGRQAARRDPAGRLEDVPRVAPARLGRAVALGRRSSRRTGTSTART